MEGVPEEAVGGAAPEEGAHSQRRRVQLRYVGSGGGGQQSERDGRKQQRNGRLQRNVVREPAECDGQMECGPLSVWGSDARFDEAAGSNGQYCRVGSAILVERSARTERSSHRAGPTSNGWHVIIVRRQLLEYSQGMFRLFR